jgi:hypothetical protein
VESSVAKQYFWETAPAKELRNLLNWVRLDQHRYSATRARLLLVQSETDFDFHGPSLNKFTIGPTKMRILVKHEQVSSATAQITETIRSVTSERILNQISSKISSGLTAGVPGNSVKLGSELLTKNEYEVTETTEQALAHMTSYSLTDTVGQEHEMTLESPGGQKVAEERRRYKQVTWDFYLHSCDYLELEYDRRWYWPRIKRSFKSPSSSELKWPLVRVVFYVPQPEMDVVWQGDPRQLVDFPDKIEVHPLMDPMPKVNPPAIESLEKLARLAFPATKEEKKAASDYQRAVKKAAKKAPTRYRGAPAKKAVAKKAPAKKAVKKAVAKKAVKKAPAKKSAAKKALKKAVAKKAMRR